MKQGAPRTAVRNLTISYADFADSEEPTTVTEEVAFAINDILARVSIPQLSSHDQLRLANIIECVSVMEKHRQSIDVNGSRFLIFFRESATKAARSIHGPSSVSWREIVWAFHSNCQEILVDLVSTHYNGKMSWIHARECGLFMWTKDYNTLVRLFDPIMFVSEFQSP